MRKRHWLSKLLSGALWAALPAAGLAQAPDAGYVPYVDPNTPQAAGMVPSYGGIEAAGWPQGATQWPYISPYTSPPVDQHSYQNGFWFNEQIRGDRKYFTYLGATYNTYADPDDVIVGDPDAPGYVVSPVQTGNTNNANVVNGQLYDMFARHDWSAVEDKMSGGGFYGIIGWMDPTDRGGYLTGFWAEEGTSSYDPINPIGDPSRPESTLLAVAGVPLFDGQGYTELPIRPPATEPVIVEGGGTQPYDMMYRLAWQSQSYGAGLGLYGSSFYKTDTFRFRPIYGLRYLNIRENATFDGMDSGLSYLVQSSSGGTTGGTGTNTTMRGRPVPGSVIGVGLVDPLESHLRSNTKSQLAGPEIGLGFELGGDKFRVQMSSKLGILANHSTREIDGYGIGRTTAQTGTAPITPIPLDPSLTSFHQQETTTHVSPTFEQTILVSAPILQFVPGVRKVRMFHDANFNVGYTWLVAGAVYRPGNVIDWKGFPNYPELNDDRTTWFLGSWNFGVEWEY